MRFPLPELFVWRIDGTARKTDGYLRIRVLNKSSWFWIPSVLYMTLWAWVTILSCQPPLFYFLVIRVTKVNKTKQVLSVPLTKTSTTSLCAHYLKKVKSLSIPFLPLPPFPHPPLPTSSSYPLASTILLSMSVLYSMTYIHMLFFA